MHAVAIVVLAAGLGTRMKSRRPKVLHAIAGRAMLGHVLDAAAALEPNPAVVVTAPDAPEVQAEAQRWLPGAITVAQKERLGTAHAVMQALPELAHFEGTVLVLYGDVPLVRSETLKRLVQARKEQGADLVILAFTAADPTGYGRLLLNDQGDVTGIREEVDATDEEKKIRLCNSGIIAIDADLLRALLPRVSNDNAKGEYYLTDLVAMAAAEGRKVVHVLCDEEEVMGVNDRVQLAAAEAAMQNRLRLQAMRDGATFQDPTSVFLSFDTKLAPDVVIEPWVWFGPGVTVGEGAVIRAHSHIEQATIAPHAMIGPFARLRPGAEIATGAKIGNFVEVKKATVEEGAKVNHFTYIGDARVGARANIGAGTITCNYDGFSKHFTDIGAEAFIGSNSSLVAPVKIGRGAYVGSGSVITEDVPEEALALARARQVNKPGWARRFREKMRALARKTS
ncbi:bifunctional UDP-N-acetylglucosamine diphosphorylase/glucosamine-1-phosphate N-acetyltransferase GlmU [Thermopetrobacter sp. TC1]|uniref:bifunctional UDP-N-acetylglucosamine diphosphorylase/glucosamine-1-phosphate N-acetyltransferase GlmU n=1 Tax=Thermopetrobacter sp. TC1 TaxID=1495045 RepID=UPI00056E98C1|nr:bifunctional UDP-N-acetylglucosamine diphosphorylase/glucosamine-1-phosphate N-acetyltransferase GlmU [Thermopetrobacter sp. TC1]